jgi:hypothetical protein
MLEKVTDDTIGTLMEYILIRRCISALSSISVVKLSLSSNAKT